MRKVERLIEALESQKDDNPEVYEAFVEGLTVLATLSFMGLQEYMKVVSGEEPSKHFTKLALIHSRSILRAESMNPLQHVTNVLARGGLELMDLMGEESKANCEEMIKRIVEGVPPTKPDSDNKGDKMFLFRGNGDAN